MTKHFKVWEAPEVGFVEGMDDPMEEFVDEELLTINEGWIICEVPPMEYENEYDNPDILLSDGVMERWEAQLVDALDDMQDECKVIPKIHHGAIDAGTYDPLGALGTPPAVSQLAYNAGSDPSELSECGYWAKQQVEKEAQSRQFCKEAKFWKPAGRPPEWEKNPLHTWTLQGDPLARTPEEIAQMERRRGAGQAHARIGRSGE